MHRTEVTFFNRARMLSLSWLILPAALSFAACSGAVQTSERQVRGGSGASGGKGGSGGAQEAPEDPNDPIPSTAKACGSDRASSGPASWRRLTSIQYKNTIKDLLGVDVDTKLFLDDTTTGRFTTNAGAATPDGQILKYQDTAAKLASEAVKDLEKLTGCKAGADEDDCAARFFDEFGSRAWRRPLNDEDRALLQNVYQVGKQESFASGIRLALEAILQSPSFMYLVEIGESPSDGVAALSPYEMASRLSYVLWNTMPDAELTEAAREGRIEDEDGLREQIERLMDSPRFLGTLVQFHEELFGIDKLTKTGVVVRDPKLYPDYNEALAVAMRQETQHFVGSVFSQGEGTLRELLTAPYGFPTGPLVELYGVGAPDEDTGKVTFPEGTRQGILSQAATLTATVPTDTLLRAVLRGRRLREQVFCQELPELQEAAVFKPRPGVEKMTQQEMLRVHQEDPSCEGCHKLMDPLGFAFENFDGIGRYRTIAEDGNPVDTSGNVIDTDVEGSFDNVAAFIEKVASSRTVRSCFAQQWFKYALARDAHAEAAEDADACSMAKVRDVLARGDGDLRKALTSLLMSDSFRYRGGL